MALDGQTKDFRQLAERVEADEQADAGLKDIIREVKELSDTNSDNDEIKDVLENNFEAGLNITEEQVRTLTKELGRLENKYKDKPEILQQIQDLTSLLEWKIDWEQRSESFNKLNGLIPDKLPRLKQELSSQDKRNIEKFIKSPTNTNQVMEMYLRMLSVQIDSDLPWVGSGDKKVFRKIKWWIEEKYNDEAARWTWELDNKIFTADFFTDWINANPEWDGSDVQDDAKIREMKKWPHMFTSEQFKEKFKTKNQERKTNNETTLWGLGIEQIVDMTKIIKKTEADNTIKVYLDKGDGTKEELTQENFMATLEITKEKVGEKLQWTQFVGNELETAIAGKQEDWFNAIKLGATEIPEPTPQESLENADAIGVSLFNNIEKETVKGAVDDAKAHLEWLSTEDRQKFSDRIDKVIKALKDTSKPLSNSKKPWYESIQELQKEMNREAGLSRPLNPDWKLWQYTFFVMKNYMWLTATQWETLVYERGGSLSGMQKKIAELIGAEDNETALNDLGVYATGDKDVNQVALELIDNSNRRWYLKNYLKNYRKEPFPWRSQIEDMMKPENAEDRKDLLQDLQLALIPYYNWHIDWLMWPSTLTAIENYSTATKERSSDENANTTINTSPIKIPSDEEKKVNRVNANTILTKNRAYFYDSTADTWKDFMYTKTTKSDGNGGTITTLTATVDRTKYTTTDGGVTLTPENNTILDYFATILANQKTDW